MKRTTTLLLLCVLLLLTAAAVTQMTHEETVVRLAYAKLAYAPLLGGWPSVTSLPTRAAV
jgi:hypothetical protein